MMNFFEPHGLILVTGSNGQLGSELQKIAPGFSSYDFLFTSKADLPIDNFDAVREYFFARQIDHCINCAAYTHVDKAEADREKAFLLNGDAVGNLARICKEHGTQFIHISSDYVFDGTSTRPYREDDRIAPINIYGSSKLRGEELAFNNNPSTTIIRTSWVYSSFGNNFVKTMVRLMNEREKISVVNDQFGCPTYAADLALVIMKIIENPTTVTGIFNYCNAGSTTWYQFAMAIKKMINSSCVVEPVTTDKYPVVAKRPRYSVLDTSKISSFLDIQIPGWEESLEKCLQLISGTQST
jgi:dTDP-4-dehydrorhamnose reductase